MPGEPLLHLLPFSPRIRDSDPGDAESALPVRFPPPFTPWAYHCTTVGRSTRSGAEFSPFDFNFEDAAPIVLNSISLHDLLVRRANSADPPDDASVAGSDDDDEDDVDDGPPPPPPPPQRTPEFTYWVHPPPAPAPPPYLAKAIRCAPPGASPGPRSDAEFTFWVHPPAPPAPAPYLAKGIRCSPPSTSAERAAKPTRAEVERRQRVKKRNRDRRVREQHREERRVASGSRLKAISHRRAEASEPMELTLDIDGYRLPVATSGWQGVRQDEPASGEYELQQLLRDDPEMEVVDWHGTPTPVLDRDRRVMLLLAGIPPGATDWQEKVVSPAAAQMEAAAAKIFPTSQRARRRAAEAKAKANRRGSHRASHVGGGMGGGQEFPQNLFHSVVNLAIFASLFGGSCFQRIAGWTNAMFMAFAPTLHTYYATTLHDLFSWDAQQRRARHLHRNLPPNISVFSTATFNFGPRTVTRPHIDFGNLAWGWCAITALGRFNPDLGGHLVLWDLKLIIRFPPGSTILIPSAILRHSNLKIQPGETRYSFTQFTPAGIFRWVYNGFRTDKDIDASKDTTPEQRERRARERGERWKEGIKMYRTWGAAAK